MNSTSGSIHKKLDFTINTQPDGTRSSVQSMVFSFPFAHAQRIESLFKQDISTIDLKDQPDVKLLKLLEYSKGFSGKQVYSHPALCWKFSADFSKKPRGVRVVFNLLKHLREYCDAQTPPVIFPELNRLYDQYKNELQIKPKSKRAKSRANFKPKRSKPKSSHNPTVFAEKESKTIPGKKTDYVVKGQEGGKGSAVHEWEALFSERYRLLLGVDRHPKSRVLHNEHGEIAGVASKVVPFTEFSHQFNTTGVKFTKKEILAAGVGHVSAGLFLYQESDGHGANVGFGSNGQAMKIDNDRSFWTRTHKYHGEPVGAEFTISEDRIRSFPILPEPFSSDAMQWIFSNAFRKAYDFDIDQLKTDHEFKRQVFQTFLKELLIPDSVDRAMADLMGSLNRKNQAYAFFRDTKQKLKSVLMNMPEFEEFLWQYPEVIDDITKEFQDYNDSVRKKSPELQVDLNSVKKEFLKYQVDLENRCDQILTNINNELYTVNGNYAAIEPKLEGYHRQIQRIKKIHDVNHKGIDTNLLNTVTQQLNSLRTKSLVLGDLYTLLQKQNTVFGEGMKNIKLRLKMGFIHNSFLTVERPIKQDIEKHLKQSSIFSNRKHENKTLYRALKDLDANIKWNPQMTTVKELLLVQKKRDAAVKILKKIDQLNDHPTPKKMEKARQLQQLIFALKDSKNVNKEIKDCVADAFKERKYALSRDFLFASRGIGASTAKKLVRELERTPDSLKVVNRLGKK